MEKYQKIKAEYKFHTYVNLGKARKTRLTRFEPHPDSTWSCVLLRTCRHCLPSATSV